VIEFCNALPPTFKMRGLTEKYLLKKSMGALLPPAIASRTKQPYRAPDAGSFFYPGAPEYVQELLSAENLRQTGYFDPGITAHLVNKCGGGRLLGIKDNMAIVYVLSTLLLHEQFIKNFHLRAPDPAEGRTINASHHTEA
jgi:asparagine synthase (glutamine-hydrolysing)